MIKQHTFTRSLPEQLPEHYKVDRLAWGIALASLGAAMAIIYLVVHFATSAFRHIHREQFDASLTSSRTSDSLDHLRQLFEGPPLLNLLPGSATQRPSVARETVDDLVSSLGSLSPDELFGADQQLALAAERARRQSGHPSGAFQILSNLRETLRPLLTQQQLLQNLYAEKEQLLKHRSSALAQFDLVVRDVTDLFSLPPHFTDPQDLAPSFYDAGILKGLPTLPELPDNLSSFTELREKLNHAGGRLQASGGQMVESLLTARLSSLREGASAVSSTLHDLDAKLSQLKGVIEGDQNQLQQGLRVYSDELRDKIRELLE